MKKIILAAVLMLSCVGAFAQSGKDLYKKYSKEKEVSAVYISPAMFNLMGRVPDMDIEGEDVNLSPVIKSLSGLYIIESENVRVNAKLSEDVKKFVASEKFELLMEAKEEDEVMQMYIISEGDYVTSFVMLALEDDECAFICMEGKMLREEMMKLIGGAISDNM